MAAPFHIRPFEEDDLVDSTRLWRELEPGITDDDFRTRVQGSTVIVAVDESSKVMGVARLSRRPAAPKTQYFLWIVVEPDARRQGIGRALFEQAVQNARSEGVTNLISRIPDDHVAANAFSEALGFHNTRHMVNLEMSLADFDPAPIVAKLDALQQQGIRIVTYAELGDTLENQHRLHELNRTLSAQIPITEHENFPTFEVYVETRMQPPLFPHEGIFIALDGSAHEEWIGMSGMSIHHWGDFAFNEMTGVLPTYTGRGIAQALKLLSTQFAQQQGVSIVRTINDVGNAPMLAVNQKLGYMPQGGFYFTKRWL